ncbi:MAG: ABC transporter substrate-binding protein [Clostridia bacterium]|nr:ABC transporter substrate-binding protein [Clostridia bacterium]
MKKHFTMALTLLLVLALCVGCAAAPAQQAAPAAAPAEAPAAEPAAEAPAAEPAAAAAEPIKIGAILPLSSSAGLNGAKIRSGMEFAAGEINASGGLNGSQIELIFEDIESSNPSLALSAAEKLINQDKVNIIVGCYGSSASLAVLPVCEEYGVVMLEPVATSAALTSGSEWIFRISSTNSIDAEKLGAYLPGFGFNNIAYLPVDNDWGASVVKSYVPILEGAGATTVLNMPITIGETNYLSQLTKIENSGADSIIITQDIESNATLIRQIVEAGMENFTILSTSGNNASMVYSLVGDAAAGCYFVEYYQEEGMEGGAVSEANAAFVKAFKAAYPDTPADYFTVQGYSAVNVIKEAVAIAGSAERTAIRDAMREVKYDGLRGLIEFDEFGQSHGDVVLTQLQEGGVVKVIDYAK